MIKFAGIDILLEPATFLWIIEERIVSAPKIKQYPEGIFVVSNCFILTFEHLRLEKPKLIRAFVSDYLMRVLGHFGFRVERIVDKSKVQDFLDQLRPITTEVELIRIGGNDDGGYLIPNDLGGIIALFSPGVAETATFELEIAQKGIKSYLADYSVDNSPSEHEYIEFDKKFIGSRNNDQFMTLAEWVNSKQLPEVGDLLLQMDIEGSEYETILSTANDLLGRFRILVIEFHFLDKVSTYFGNKLIIETFSKLLTQFKIVHIHPNNCCAPILIHGKRIHPCIEVTFFRRDRFEKSNPTTNFPHALDRPNLKGKPDYQLILK